MSDHDPSNGSRDDHNPLPRDGINEDWRQRGLETFNLQLVQMNTAYLHSPSELPDYWRIVQTLFQTQVLPLMSVGADRPGAVHLISILTEMNRLMRLLGIEMTFWQTAQEPQRAAQRLGQIGQRLQQLQGFGQALQAAEADFAELDTK